MKKVLYFLITTLSLNSCGNDNSKYENNYVITSMKAKDSINCMYEYPYDNNGLTMYIRFVDSCGKFKIGQTIKIKPK